MDRSTRPIVSLSLSILLQVGFGAYSAVGQDCPALWQRAQGVIARECNDAIDLNTLCYAHAPLSTVPDFSNFRAMGDRRPIDQTLQSIDAHTGGAIGGFSFLKVMSGKPIAGVTFGQAIILIAFGDTSLLQIVSRAEPADINAGDICTAVINPRSTQFGGSFIRALPDPRFTIECAPYPCNDKSNLLFFVNEGEEMMVKGRNQAADAILVHNRYATGWITADPRYVRLYGCDKWSLPTFPDNIVVEAQASRVDLPIVSEFRLLNRTTAESEQCLYDNRPPGGLLILNPGHQTIVFTVNAIQLELSSSAFLTHHGSVTKAFILQGSARITAPGGQTVAATSGEAVEIVEGNAPVVLSPDGRGVYWCDALSQLARSAYGNLGPLRVPAARLDYCSLAGGSYPLGTIVFDSFRQPRGLGLPPSTSTPPAAPPPAPQTPAPADPQGGIIDRIPF